MKDSSIAQIRKFNLKEMPTLLPHNLSWPTIFRSDMPVDVEIGSGRPHFFFDRAIHYPERAIVCMEWKYEFVEQANRRIAREKINNALAFHGNAWLLVPLLFKAKSISQIFVNFPDPWWKSKHKKRLILNEIFLSALRKRMKNDGLILLQTDVQELFDYYRHLIENHGEFTHASTICDEEIIAQTKATTHREKKCLQAGMRIYRAVFRPTGSEE